MRRRVVRQLTRAAAIAAACAVLSAPGSARAAVCAPPDVIDTYPPDGATNVPTNATLTARYVATAEYIDEDVTLTEVATDGGLSDGGAPGAALGDGGAPDGGSGSLLGLELSFKAQCDDPNADAGPSTNPELPPGAFCFSRNEGLLKLKPPRDLTPHHAYRVEWPKLRGLNTASRGRGASVTFTVGSGPDRELPRFGGLAGMSWDVQRTKDDCTNQEIDRFVFDLVPGPASDDFGSDLLVLRVFQTKGPNIAPSLGRSGANCDANAASGRQCPPQIGLIPFPSSGNSARIDLSLDDGTGDVCFAAHAEDLFGHRSNGDDKEVCATTTRPPFFYGCSAVRAGARSRPAALLLALLLSLAWRRRHRSIS